MILQSGADMFSLSSKLFVHFLLFSNQKEVSIFYQALIPRTTILTEISSVKVEVLPGIKNWFYLYPLPNQSHRPLDLFSFPGPKFGSPEHTNLNCKDCGNNALPWWLRQ